jgi:large subunit ribosomal protein L13
MTSHTAGTYSAKAGEIQKKWHLIDAKGMILGRLAAEIAKLLRGKHKAQFTPHMDCGDHVVVINAKNVAVKGNNKLLQKLFFWHTGHPGGVKEASLEKRINGKYPERVIQKAVQRMLPKESPLARKQLGCLYVYASDEHPHQAQQPQVLDLASKNRKNTK